MADKYSEAARLYADLMEELKIRRESIAHAVDGKTGLIKPLARQYCFLQLRTICELIALGCLVAHGDLSKHRPLLRKAYAADMIMHELSKLHDEFYPKPIVTTNTADGDLHLEPFKGVYLTRAELKVLYNKTGDYLHRGNLRKLLAPNKPQPANFADIIEWANKVGALLKEHRISLIDPKKLYIVQLSNQLQGGKTIVAFAIAP